MKKRNLGANSKQRKAKSALELLEELKALPKQKQIDKLAKLYLKKCWKDQMIVDGKFNFRGYNYVVNQIKQFYSDSDIPMTYEYLLSIQYEPLTVYGAMKNAQDKLLKTKSKVQEEKVKDLNVDSYSDYLGDILKCL